jgi:elongation factor 1-beta
MSKVLLTLKVMPEDVNVDIKNLKSDILSKIEANIQEVPIAFGLSALHVSLLIEDKEGEVEKVERILRGIKGVGEIEVIEVARTL